MGTQFWWFYDVIAGAILLVCMFIGGKKGVMKAAFSAIGCALAVIIAFAASNAVGEGIYKGTVQTSNAKKLNKVIDRDVFVSGYGSYLESLGYGIKVNNKKLHEIFASGEPFDEQIAKYVNNINSRKVEKDEAVLIQKVQEGYAVVMRDLVEKGLNKYAAETAAKEIREHPETIEEFVSQLGESDMSLNACRYAAEHYTAVAYKTTFRLISFLLLSIVLALVILVIIRASMPSQDRGAGIASRAAGAVLGAVMGVAIIFVVAAFVRTCAVMGSDEMLFFNNKEAESSYVFKYFYELAKKM